jgi:hypothetical protein
MEQYDVNIFHQPYILLKIIGNLSQKMKYLLARVYYVNSPSTIGKNVKICLKDNIDFIITNTEIFDKIKLIISMNYKMRHSVILQDIIINFRTEYKFLNIFNELANNYYINENPFIDAFALI